MKNIYTLLSELTAENKRAVVCTIIHTLGSTPRKAGTKMVVMADGSTWGTIGGGEFEKRVREEALQVLQINKPLIFEFDLSQDREMTCGGKAGVFLDPLAGTLPLYIFGGGHIGKAVARMASGFGFAVTILDDREEIRDAELEPSCSYMIGDFMASLEKLPVDENTFIVIATSSHSSDEQIITRCIGNPFAYLGMIGSRSKVADFKRRLLDSQAATEEVIEKVNMPIGIPFHAETPQEIAISIVAKLIDVKNTRG